MKRFLLFALTFLSISGHAERDPKLALTEILDEAAPPNQVCQVQWLYARDSIEVVNKKGEKETEFKYSTLSSAVVIGESRVLIAASSIPDSEATGPYTARLICQEGKTLKVFKNLPIEFPKRDKEKQLNDFAVLNVQGKIGIAPAKIPKDMDQWNALYNNKNCVIAGFGGKKFDLTAKATAMRALVLGDQKSRLIVNIGEMPGVGEKLAFLTDKQISAGDAGGGLMCKDPKSCKDFGKSPEKDIRCDWYVMNVIANTFTDKGKVSLPTLDVGKKLTLSDGKEFSESVLSIGVMNSTPVISKWITELEEADAKEKAKLPLEVLPQPRVVDNKGDKPAHK